MMRRSANRIMIYGPKDDGTYVVEFRTAAGEALAISIPRNEAGVIRHKNVCPTGCSCRTFHDATLPRVRRIRLPLVAYRTDAVFEKMVGC
jgi:hypothetical protein